MCNKILSDFEPTFLQSFLGWRLRKGEFLFLLFGRDWEFDEVNMFNVCFGLGIFEDDMCGS